MINFLRKIRYDNMKKQNTGRPAFTAGKYLKYAVGEILLVVIGILIAFNINNWNEIQKNNAKKEILLKALKIEFTSNLTQLDTVLHYDNIVLKNTHKLMKLVLHTSFEVVKDSLPHWLQNSAFRWTFDPLNGALRTGISSGEIHLIKNDSLSNLLFGWSDFVADAKEGEARTVDAVKASKTIIEKYVRLIDYKSSYTSSLGKSKFPSDYQSLFNDPLFEDYLGERALSMEEAIKDLMLVKDKNTAILKLIDKALRTN
jgi:Family of unknown function (DUF6090)